MSTTELAEISPLTVIQTAMETGANPEALKQLLDLQERYEANNARKAFNQAYVAAQAEIPIIFKDSQGHHGSYAKLEKLMGVLRPILDKHGLAISFEQEVAGDQLTVTCKIMHRDGHSQDTRFTMPAKGSLVKGNEAQQMGSANSYARRYCLMNALNIATTDDDAKALNEPIETVSEEQAIELKELTEDNGIDTEKFLSHFGADSFLEFPAAKYSKAMSMISDRAKKNQGGAE